MKLSKGVNYLFLLMFLLSFLGSTASATNVDIKGQTQNQVLEGQEINYTLTINDIPSAADYISFDTDLVKTGNFHLYNFTNLNITNDNNKFNLPVNESTKSIIVNIHGQTPQITEKEQYGRVTLITYKQSTGYAYDRITLTNSNGDLIESVETRPFEISNPEVESFREQMNKIDDPFFKNYLQDLHDKGLVTESKTLADHLTGNAEWPSYWWLILGAFVGIIIGFVIARVIGSREPPIYE
jgi:hypothetical protein